MNGAEAGVIPWQMVVMVIVHGPPSLGQAPVYVLLLSSSPRIVGAVVQFSQ